MIWVSYENAFHFQMEIRRRESSNVTLFDYCDFLVFSCSVVCIQVQTYVNLVQCWFDWDDNKKSKRKKKKETCSRNYFLAALVLVTYTHTYPCRITMINASQSTVDADHFGNPNGEREHTRHPTTAAHFIAQCKTWTESLNGIYFPSISKNQLQNGPNDKWAGMVCGSPVFV